MTEHNFVQAEALLHGMRKTRQGCVVSFLLHPNEIPQELQLADLGTRVLLAVAEITDEKMAVETDALAVPEFLKRSQPEGEVR